MWGEEGLVSPGLASPGLGLVLPGAADFEGLCVRQAGQLFDATWTLPPDAAERQRDRGGREGAMCAQIAPCERKREREGFVRGWRTKQQVNWTVRDARIPHSRSHAMLALPLSLNLPQYLVVSVLFAMPLFCNSTERSHDSGRSSRELRRSDSFLANGPRPRTASMFRSKIPEVDVESRSPVPKVPAQFSAKRNGGSPWNNGKHSQTGGFYVGISNNDSDETVHKIAVRKPSFFRRFARGAPREATSPDRGELAGSGAAKQWSTKADEGIDGMASEMDRLFSSAGNRLPDQRAEMPPRSSRSPRHGLGIRFGSVDSKGGSEDIRNGAGRRNAAALANLPGGVTSIKSRDFASEQRLSTMRLPADLIGSPFMDDDTISELSRPLAMQMLGERAEAEPASMASSAAEEATPAVSQGSKLTSVQTLGQEQAKATSRHQHLADPVDIPARRSSFSDQTRQMLHKNLGLTEVSPVKPKGSPEMLSVDRTLRNQLDRYNTQVRQGCESIHKAALTAWSQGAADDDGGGGGGGGGRDDSGLEAEGIRQLQNLGLDGSMTRRRCREHLLDLMAHVAHSHLLGESVSTFQGVGLTARETDIVQDVAFKALEKGKSDNAACAHRSRVSVIYFELKPYSVSSLIAGRLALPCGAVKATIDRIETARRSISSSCSACQVSRQIARLVEPAASLRRAG